jgi:hypothetical protein
MGTGAESTKQGKLLKNKRNAWYAKQDFYKTPDILVLHASIIKTILRNYGL